MHSCCLDPCGGLLNENRSEDLNVTDNNMLGKKGFMNVVVSGCNQRCLAGKRSQDKGRQSVLFDKSTVPWCPMTGQQSRDRDQGLSVSPGTTRHTCSDKAAPRPRQEVKSAGQVQQGARFGTGISTV